MRLRTSRVWSSGVGLVLLWISGCGDGTEVTLAKVPPVTPAPKVDLKPNKRIPKNARFSPPADTGEAQK